MTTRLLTKTEKTAFMVNGVSEDFYNKLLVCHNNNNGTFFLDTTTGKCHDMYSPTLPVFYGPVSLEGAENFFDN